MWLLTTKDRPEWTRRLAQACLDTGMTEPCLVVIDGGSEYPDFPMPDSWSVVYNADNLGVGPLMQWFYETNPGLDYYGWLADDFVPKTEAWDKKLRPGPWEIAYCDDLSIEYKIPPKYITSAFAVDGDLVREVGWFSPPGLKQVGIDSAWNMLGRKFNLQSFRPDVVVEHIRWQNGKREKDATDNDIPAEAPLWEAFKEGPVYREAVDKLSAIDAIQLTVACVNVGNYEGRGSEYVNILHDMVRRNTDRGMRFVCLTDDPAGLDDDIIPIKATEEGWWAKLELFKHLTGETWFFDLDTVITGWLDYETPDFGILRDFYRRDGYNSSVMMWRWNHSHIYTQWVEAGKPKTPGGDQEWVEYYPAKILQDMHPGQFVSYRQSGFIEGAKVVCFHGRPKPHECDGWVPGFWKVGGLQTPRFIETLNNPAVVQLAQFRENMERDVPWFHGSEPHDRIASLIGGGPSLSDTVGKIRGDVFALNNTHDWLINHGIMPKYHVMLDSRADNAKFVRSPLDSVRYLISAFCHPSVFEALEGYDVTLWMSDMDGVTPLLRGDYVLVGGGATVGLKTLYLAYLMGYRRFDVHGFDSCYRDGMNHAYKQPLNDGEQVIEITAAGRTFQCAPWMAKQAKEFQQQVRELMSRGCQITIHGSGLIPWIYQHKQVSHANQ